MAPAKTGICVVGACFTDLIAYTPRMPGPGETLHGNKFASGFGGKGANQAVQAARLGASVVMVSKLGDDTFGADTLRNFREQGVDAEFVQTVPNASSGVAPITVCEQTGQNSIIIVPGALDHLSAADVEKAREKIRGCRLLIVQLEAPLAATLAALRLAKEEGVETLLNTAPAKELPDEIWPLCDIVCPNEPELQMLSGMPTSTNDEVAEAVGALMKKGAKRVLVTLGERGCALFEGGAPCFVPGAPAKARDTTGAGDSFLGAFAAHYVAGNSMLESMATGNSVASVSVTREGTQKSFPTADEMMARQAIGLIDHTSLGLDDTEEKIRCLADAAVAEEPFTAALCVYPKFVKMLREMQAQQPQRYARSLKICTVVNFPSGQEPVEKVVADTKVAVADGADEVDVVIDYQLMLADEAKGHEAAKALVSAVRAVCPKEVVLKVIIESGELKEARLIESASRAAIAGGCDFTKTSTGKVQVNATPEVARVMLEVIAKHQKAPGSKPIGFKAAGGVRDLAQSRVYLEMAAEILFGDRRAVHKVDSTVLRFGASSLLPALRECCGARNPKKRKLDDSSY